MTSAELSLGQSLYALDALEERVGQVIRQLPLRGPDGSYLIDDAALRTTTLTAQSASKTLWKLACAARAEIVRRISERTSDSTVVAREIAREAAEQGVSVRVLRRDAAVGQVFGPLFAEPDAVPDLSVAYYEIARTAPDPQAALALAAQRKDENPLYGVHDFAAEVARARIADPAAGYGSASVGRCALAYIAPYWDQGVLEATEKALELPLRRWLLPDALVLLRAPPRALDLCVRILATHDLHYQTAFFVPMAPFRDACAWHEKELVLCATRGQLRLPDGIPGTWRDRVERSIDLYFQSLAPRLVVYPRHGTACTWTDWTTPDVLPSHIR